MYGTCVLAKNQVQVDIGGRIKQARKQAGLTQFELAAKVEQKPRTIQAWELNERTPRLGALMRLALALGQPVDYFYGNGDKAA